MNNNQHPLLASLASAEPLRDFSRQQLAAVAAEIRDVLCNLLATRTAHFASNLGVVELCLALHCEFDFRHDRLIWDTGHQVYPHKLVTVGPKLIAGDEVTSDMEVLRVFYSGAIGKHPEQASEIRLAEEDGGPGGSHPT